MNRTHELLITNVCFSEAFFVLKQIVILVFPSNNIIKHYTKIPLDYGGIVLVVLDATKGLRIRISLIIYLFIPLLSEQSHILYSFH